jgi:hypothetical protein
LKIEGYKPRSLFLTAAGKHSLAEPAKAGCLEKILSLELLFYIYFGEDIILIFWLNKKEEN